MCPASETCTENGCASETVDPGQLPSIDPGREFNVADAQPTSDAGEPAADAAETPDTGAESDGATPRDGGAMDAGARQDAQAADGAAPDAQAPPDAGPLDTGPSPVVRRRISAGSGHMCVERSGAAICWGDDEFGKVGQGRRVLAIEPPTPVTGVDTAVSVASNSDYDGSTIANALATIAGPDARLACPGDVACPTGVVPPTSCMTGVCSDANGVPQPLFGALIPIARNGDINVCRYGTCSGWMLFESVTTHGAFPRFDIDLVAQMGSTPIPVWGENSFPVPDTDCVATVDTTVGASPTVMLEVRSSVQQLPVGGGDFELRLVVESTRFVNVPDEDFTVAVDPMNGGVDDQVVCSVINNIPQIKARIVASLEDIYKNAVQGILDGVVVWPCGGPTDELCPSETSCGPESVCIEPGGPPIQQLLVSPGHSCALSDAGTVQCWGRGIQGALGGGTAVQRTERTPLPVMNLDSAIDVAAGPRHTCAVRTFGDVLCWGSREDSLFAPGASAVAFEPVVVPGVQRASEVTAGTDFTCVRTQLGAVYCWGKNDAGQLGDGTMTERPNPAVVPGLQGALHVSAGARHACAVLDGGEVRCWGDNSSGQLGDGTTMAQLTPVPVTNITNAVQVAAGGAHTCALGTDRAVTCWGEGADGQLGDGMSRTSNTPVAAGLVDATDIAVGRDYSCANRANGTLWCWGNGRFGRFGDATISGADQPVMMALP